MRIVKVTGALYHGVCHATYRMSPVVTLQSAVIITVLRGGLVYRDIMTMENGI